MGLEGLLKRSPGFSCCGVYADAENPLKLHFFERWADEAAIRQHFAVPESRAFAKQLRKLADDAGKMHVLQAELARFLVLARQ